MRIRLCVKRNGLPDASLLWPAVEQVNGTKQKIADLITAVNETMPMESLNWALEDYVVEIGAFECLHWQYLSDVLKDEDQVIIRPIEQVEVRARQISGRHQISAAGFHLVDGVPFGTRPLRPLSRPSVVIPPRKRRRILTDAPDGQKNIIEPGAQLSIADVDDDEQQLALLNSGNATLKEGPVAMEAPSSEDERPSKRAKTTKSVRFRPVGGPDGDDDDDDDDEDFDDSEDPSGSDRSSSSEDSSDVSDDADDSDAPSEESLHRDKLKVLQEKPAQAKAVDSAPPHQGKPITRNRNKRRQDQKRRMHLIRTGILPSNSNLEDFRQFLLVNGRSYRPGLETTEPVTVSSDSSSSSESDSDDSSSSSDSIEASTTANIVPLINGAPQQPNSGTNGDFGHYMDLDRAEALLHEAFEVGRTPENEPALDFGRASKNKHLASYIIRSGDPKAEEVSNSPRLVAEDASSVLEAIALRQLAAEAVPKKRARLNVDGAKRVIFGNLGQRTPKTKADGELVRAKLMDISKPQKSIQEAPTTTVDDVAPESEAWRSKIHVMACECVDEGIVLSEPPYPFQQRWDPQQWYTGGNRQKKKRKKNNRKGYGSEAVDYEEDYEGDYYPEGDYDDSILLNYDEEDAVTGQLTDAKNENAEQLEDLPYLPEDINTLPTADRDDLRDGTIIAFKQLEMGANFMPEMTGYRTAKIIKCMINDLDGLVLLRLALRDRKKEEPKRYDNNGNRVYKGLEMPQSDDEGDEDTEDYGDRSIRFADLVDPRIVKMASSNDIFESAANDAAATQLLEEAQNGN